MARSGAILREIGTTNRTRIDDYERAITERTRLILRVHPSNFHLTGFTARPSLEQLTSLDARAAFLSSKIWEAAVCSICERIGIHEPTVQAKVWPPA